MPQAGAPGPQQTTQSQMLADGAWIMSCPQQHLEATLPSWMARNVQAPPAPYHEHMAHVSLARLRKEAERAPTMRSPVLVTCFWTHFLRAVKDDQMVPSKILGELLNPQPPGHETLWTLEENETIHALANAPEMGAKRLGPDNLVMWRNILLRLQVQTQPNVARSANRRMKM
jgi:hypothetical protein